MSKTNNQYEIEGIIYEKNTRVAFGKKKCPVCNGSGELAGGECKECKGKGKVDDTDKRYEFNSLILEVSRQYKDSQWKELPEFDLGKGVGLVDFNVGSKVVITFSLSGKRISPSWHKTSIRAHYIRHADINANDTREVGGKTPSEYSKERAKDEETFNPVAVEDDDDDGGDLPF